MESPRPARRGRALIWLAPLLLVALAITGLLVAGGGKDEKREPRAARLSPGTREVRELAAALRADSPDRVYALLASRVREGLSPREFERIFRRGRRQTGPVTVADARPPAPGGSAGGWVGLRVRYQRAGRRDFRAYFIRENRGWRFLSTAPEER